MIAASDLDATVERLRSELGLGEPYNDPAVSHFGLANAVFAIGDTFLEVVSPIRADTSAGRYLERRRGDGGYMLMFQLDDLAAARHRAAEQGVREVFEVDVEDITEAHLHPAQIGGAIVSISRPEPPESWRWGGAGWRERAVPGAVVGATLSVADPDGMSARWATILGAAPAAAGVEFTADPADPGLTEIRLTVAGSAERIELGGVTLAPA